MVQIQIQAALHSVPWGSGKAGSSGPTVSPQSLLLENTHLGGWAGYVIMLGGGSGTQSLAGSQEARGSGESARGWPCADGHRLRGLPPQEVELITKFLPMLMSFVVDDYTFSVDQKLPAEEKAPITYPNTLPESFTKWAPGAAVGGYGLVQQVTAGRG